MNKHCIKYQLAWDLYGKHRKLMNNRQFLKFRAIIINVFTWMTGNF